MNENEQPTADPQTGLDKIFASLHSIDIRRRSDDKWIGGVCSGLADRLGVDPVIVRAGLVLLSILGGIGVTVYLVAWVLLPNDRGEIAAERAIRDGDGSSVVLLVVAALAVFGGSWWGQDSGWGFPWGLALTGLLVWWLVQKSRHRPDADQRVRAQRSAAGPYASAPQTGAPYAGQPPTSGAAPTTPGQASTAYPPTYAPPAYAPPTYAPTTYGPTTNDPSYYRPEPPRRLRRRSGGALMALVAIGLALVTYGSLSWLGSQLSWTGDHRTIAMAGALGAIGLLLVVLGLAGWRAGFVAFLAVILAFTAWSSAVVPTGIHLGGPLGDRTWTPTTVTSTAYDVSIGTGVLDLRELPKDGLSEATIPAHVGIGELKVIVPEGLTVRVVGQVGLGNIVAPGDQNNGQDGKDVSRTIPVGDGPTEVVVDAGVGIGQLTVVKE
ncbi:MAG: PspC domain-containing protein [Dermatophilaceae bacterium]